MFLTWSSMGSENDEVTGSQSRDGLEMKCVRALSELDRLTEQRYADSQQIVAVVAAEKIEQENQQPDSSRYPSRWFYAFVLLALLAIFLVSRKF